MNWVNTEWMERAACRGLKTDLFFVPRGGSTRTARAVCARCPVVEECRDYAVANVIDYGIWGDTVPRQRRARRRDLAETRNLHRGG